MDDQTTLTRFDECNRYTHHFFDTLRWCLVSAVHQIGRRLLWRHYRESRDGRMTMEAVQDYLDQAFQTNQIPNRAKANLVMDLSLVDRRR